MAALALFIVLSSPTLASDRYKFSIRGNVTAVDRANNTVTIYTTHASSKAETDLAGEKVEFTTQGAKIYDYVKGKKHRTTLGHVPVGNEVVAKGAKKSNGQFGITELTVNGNTFSLVGVVQGRNAGDKTITINVTTSTYKEANYKGKDLVVYYGNNTVFRNDSLEQINADELASNQETAKITGTVTNSSKFEVLTVIDGYSKAK